MKRLPLTIASIGKPDPETAADAALPLFLKFLEGRRARLETRCEGNDEERGSLPSVVEGQVRRID